MIASDWPGKPGLEFNKQPALSAVPTSRSAAECINASRIRSRPRCDTVFVLVSS